MTIFSRQRPLDDPSYEPGTLYRACGKPNLGTWLFLTIVAYLAVSVAIVWGIALVA